MHEGRGSPDGKGNGGLPARSKTRGTAGYGAERGDGGGIFRSPQEVKSPEDGPCPPRAVVSVVIQEGRMNERKRRGGSAARGERGEKGGGCRGMRPWSRYIRAPVPAYARVFVYLCGTPENPADERKIKKEMRKRESKENERGLLP